MRFNQRTVLITGAGSGIGRAAALQFAREGARVAALDIDATRARDTAAAISQLGAESLALTCDVGDEPQIQRAIRGAVEAFGPIDVLFNNAGVAVRQPVAGQDLAGLDHILRVNVQGAFLCAKHAIPAMRAPGASIINTASVVGLVGVRNRAAYSLSKGAILTLTKNMALDYAPAGIRVNAVCPGFVASGMTEKLFADPERAERIRAMHPLGRLATVDDIANAVLFLASEDAAMITGQALAVDGGFTAGRPEDI